MKLVLKKFGAVWCPGCEDLKRAKTLEKFARAHPEVRVEKHDDTEKGSQKWSDLADDHKVSNIPCLVWTTNDGTILFKTTDVRPEALERQLERAKKAVGLL